MDISVAIFKGLLIAGVLYASIYLVRLLFKHTDSPTPAAVRQFITDALMKVKLNELAEEMKELQSDEQTMLAEKTRQEINKGIAESAKDADAIAQYDKEISQAASDLAELRTQISNVRKEHEDKARSYAESVLQDISSANIRTTDALSRSLFLEFTTVNIIISGVLILAILEVLNGDQLAPILASIAGYVLGRTTSGQPKT